MSLHIKCKRAFESLIAKSYIDDLRKVIIFGFSFS